MELQAPGMRLSHGELEGVPSWLWDLAHPTGQVFTPRFKRRIIEGIAGSADLEDDDVEAKPGGAVQQLAEFLLLLGDGEPGLARPIDIAHGGDPHSAEFAGDRGRC